MSDDPQALLFEASQVQTPSWLPDETLFSLCSRFHRLALSARASRTSESLFGHPRGGHAHDFPDRLAACAERCGGALGDARSIAHSHTLISYYLPFQSLSVAQYAIGALAGHGIGSLKFRLGLLTSRFRANHPLKACRQCMSEDVATAHVGYWHLAHQYPGVWVCSRHGCILEVSSLKATGVRRYGWVLPDDAALSCPSDLRGGIDNDLTVRLLGLAVAAQGLARLPLGFHFEPERLVLTPLRRLQELGLAGPTGRLHHRLADEHLRTFFEPLQRVDELAPLFARGSPTSASLVCLRDPRRVRTHPLRQLCLALSLHGSWNQFWNAYLLAGTDRPAAAQPSTPFGMSRSLAMDARRMRFVELLRHGDCSLSSASATVNIDIQTGQAWAAAAGIACKRRPKTLKGQVRAALIRAMKSGAEKAAVAERLGVSVQAVTRVLRTEVGLHDQWINVRREHRLSKERRRWQSLAAANPLSGVKAIRWLSPATYAWLYRNDRTWLNQQVEALISDRRGNHVRVDWDRRDSGLATAVAGVCESLVSEAPERRVLLWRIYQRLPELKAKLAQLDRLPLTRAAIERALKYCPRRQGGTESF